VKKDSVNGERHWVLAGLLNPEFRFDVRSVLTDGGCSKRGF
jgi:hypothetical protein